MKNIFIIILAIIISFPLPSYYHLPKEDKFIRIGFIDLNTKRKITNFKLTTVCDPFEMPLHTFFVAPYFTPDSSGLVFVNKNRFFERINNKSCEKDSIFIVFNKGNVYRFLKIPSTPLDTIFQIEL